jgi:hypothetical protein
MRTLRDSQAAVSEIVGALLLVLVVSSAAFGFGLFLHQQAKQTQAQQAAEQALRLEKIAVPGVTPLDLTDPCDGSAPSGSSDGTWDTLAFPLTSRHLHDSTITQLLLNKVAVKKVQLSPFDGSNVVDFSLGPSDPGYKALVVPAGQSVVVQLQHASCPAPFSPFFAPPAAGLPATAPLDFELVTALGNHVERAFSPPVAIATLEPTPGVASSYILVGTGSQAASADGFIAKWEWHVHHVTTGTATCSLAADPDDGTGHRHQLTVTAGAGWNYCVRLVVTDNDGLTGSTDISFSP